MKNAPPTLGARFFMTDVGGEPVRDWLKNLPVVERKAIGEDIKTVQFGWPLGMPLVALKWHMGSPHKVEQSDCPGVVCSGWRCHGFIKKEQKTPKPELDLAKERLKLLKRQK